jgi:small subunit ribosomal protein S6
MTEGQVLGRANWPVVPCFRLLSIRAFPEGLEGLGARVEVHGHDKERHSMPLYEHVFLARQDLSGQQVEDLTKQFSDVIDGLGGKVTKNEYWGLKSLSYRINKNRKAHMTLLNVEAPAAAVTEIERQERLSEDVLRYLTIRVDELEEGPSAMMRKSDRDRDERGDRGDRGGRFGDRDRGFGDRDRGERRPRHDDAAATTGSEE